MNGNNLKRGKTENSQKKNRHIQLKEYSLNFFSAIFNRIKILLSEFKDFGDDFKKSISQDNKLTVADKMGKIITVFKNHKEPFKTVFVYLLPLTLMLVTIFSINAHTNKVLALEVSYNGKVIGEVKDESVYIDAVSSVGKILVNSTDDLSINTVPTYKLVDARPSEFSNDDKIAEEIINNSEGAFEEGAGIFVDGNFISATKNPSDIRTILNKLEKNATRHFNASSAEINNQTEIKVGLYPKSDILDIDKLAEKLTGNNMTYLKNGNFSTNGTFSMRITKIENYTKSIPFKTEEVQDSSILTGYEKVLVQGREGTNQIKEVAVYVDGRKQESTILESKLLEKPIDEKIVIGVRLPENAVGLSNQYSGLFCSPISGGYVSSGFMTEARPRHRGIDLAIAAGSNIYATCDGVVTYSGWSDDGGGLNVSIDHLNGFQTRYCHCSALYVETGATVVKGQIIAAVGMTGNATGNHVHYEIKYNGYHVDPWPFIAG